MSSTSENFLFTEIKPKRWKIPYLSCINLKERTDRHESASKSFVELAKYVDFELKWYQPERDPEGGEAGCTRSHIHEVRAAYNANAEYAFISEDDLIPTQQLEFIEEIRTFVETNQDWDIIYLGGLPNIFRHRTKEIMANPHVSVYKGHCILAHAYFINRRYMAKIKDADYFGIAIDRIYENAINAYFVYLPLFKQSLSQTSIEEHKFASSKIKSVMIEAQQWYATTVNFPIEVVAYSLLGGIIIAVILWVLFPRHWKVWILAVIVLVIVIGLLLVPYYE